MLAAERGSRHLFLKPERVCDSRGQTHQIYVDIWPCEGRRPLTAARRSHGDTYTGSSLRFFHAAVGGETSAKGRDGFVYCRESSEASNEQNLTSKLSFTREQIG